MRDSAFRNQYRDPRVLLTQSSQNGADARLLVCHAVKVSVQVHE
jgi:hypothetical protein